MLDCTQYIKKLNQIKYNKNVDKFLKKIYNETFKLERCNDNKLIFLDYDYIYENKVFTRKIFQENFGILNGNVGVLLSFYSKNEKK